MKTQDHVFDDKIVTTFTEDVRPALEQATAERNSKLRCERFPKDRTFHRVAYVPATVVQEMYRRGINFLNPSPSDQRKIKALLNGEFARFKSVDAQL